MLCKLLIQRVYGVIPNRQIIGYKSNHLKSRICKTLNADSLGWDLHNPAFQSPATITNSLLCGDSCYGIISSQIDEPFHHFFPAPRYDLFLWS